VSPFIDARGIKSDSKIDCQLIRRILRMCRAHVNLMYVGLLTHSSTSLDLADSSRQGPPARAAIE
jgi:hypothetical protein